MATDQTITQEHPTYTAWVDQWQTLGHAYEGAGGFLDGAALVAHPRELDYKRDARGRLTTTVLQEKAKFKRRKDLARYENFAGAIVDTLVSYQFAKAISRTIDKRTVQQAHPLARFWDDVDGFGTHIDDWLEDTQTQADIYGHVVIVADRDRLDQPARSRAEQAGLRLVVYAPMDVPDWLQDRSRLTAIKTIDHLERATLLTPRPSDQPKQYRIWTAEGWTSYDEDGAQIDDGTHPFEELPVIVMRGRRRPGVRMPGRSVLGDASLYVDHYNLVSELRELLRAQTFSMLNIILGEKEKIAEARAMLGESSSVETILFTRAPAGFIAPGNGPAEIYQAELSKLERKMYRASGIPWETDSRDAEAEGSRRIKAGELERRLSQHADEAQRVDYAIARLVYMNEYGRMAGLARFASEDLAIAHPNEFVTSEIGPQLDDVRKKIALPIGPTAKQLILTQLVPRLIEDVSDEQIAQIQDEIAGIPIDALRGPTPPTPPAPDDAEGAEAA